MEDAAAPNASSSVHSTDVIEKRLQQIQSLLASHEEAYEVQCATMAKLQIQMNEIVEIQHAAMKQLQLQMELFANSHRQTAFETDDGSDAEKPCHFQQQQLGRQTQQEIQLSVRELEVTGDSGSPLHAPIV